MVILSAPSRLLLFDIDGTLVDTEGAGIRSLEKGFFEAFPECESQPFPPLDLRGATDWGVASYLFQHFGLADHGENRKRFFDRYVNFLEAQLVEYSLSGKGRALKGVSRLLAELDGAETYLMGLLTGNIEEGARAKLRHYSLDHRFGFGSFGGDRSLRNELGPVAIERAGEFSGRSFRPEETVIVGDTPKDIACARACGAAVIAVATGGIPLSELEDASPDILIQDFSNLEETLAAIESAFAL